jgi:hypothetical protein
MAVLSFVELARAASHKFGETPKFERRWVCTLTTPDTPATDCVTATGATHGSSHPEMAIAVCTEVVVNEQYEGSRYHNEVLAKYEVPPGTETDSNPLSRPDVWSFESSGASIPALTYFDGTTAKPLVNSAGDYFEGLTIDEAQQKVTIQGNRSAFPSAIASAITNCINSGAYLGGPENSWKCQGIRGERKVEVVDGTEVRFWEVTVTLLYRQTGWNLQIPDVGFNYVSNGKRERCWVIDPEDKTTKIPSANPVALDGSGGMKASGEAPSILNRRIYKQVDFQSYFGTPPA